jgi:hypothetical protein
MLLAVPISTLGNSYLPISFRQTSLLGLYLVGDWRVLVALALQVVVLLQAGHEPVHQLAVDLVDFDLCGVLVGAVAETLGQHVAHAIHQFDVGVCKGKNNVVVERREYCGCNIFANASMNVFAGNGDTCLSLS